MFTSIVSLFQYLHRPSGNIRIALLYISTTVGQKLKNEINDPSTIDGLYLIKASYKKLYLYIV